MSKKQLKEGYLLINNLCSFKEFGIVEHSVGYRGGQSLGVLGFELQNFCEEFVH